MTTADLEKLVHNKFPLEWIEARDFERLSFERATWIPLVVQKKDLRRGRFGTPGFRDGYRDIDSIVVPLDLQADFQEIDWQSVSRHNSDGAWADDDGFYPPASYSANPRVLHPVIQRSFATGDPREWSLLQELEVGLKLMRRGDSWIAPEEDDVEVARLERDARGLPDALFFRAEHLRDYLCAKKAALLLTGFAFREAVEETFPNPNWEKTRDEQRQQQRHFDHGWWQGYLTPIHEGGPLFGSSMHVLHMWRESVNPEDDVPIMPHPTAEPEPRHEEFEQVATGRKLFRLSGRIWVKHWISPAQKSPRIRRDEVESRVHFRVENQEQATLAGNDLEQYRGWLWFKPSVIRHILKARTSEIKWYTAQMGETGPAPQQTLHFGVNDIGLINVLGYKMSYLPEWAQKYWVFGNVAPEGGLSKELHMSQNLATPAHTWAPEAMLWNNLEILQGRTETVYGKPLLQHLPSEKEFFHLIHRFYCDSFSDVCLLCKELHRIVSETINISLLDEKIDPTNAKKSKEKKLGQIKRLALWLDTSGLDGRKATAPLAGVYDLRIADAHIASTSTRDALALLHIPTDTENYLDVCYSIIGQVANCIGSVADSIKPPGH
jgi:hypothetical protein